MELLKIKDDGDDDRGRPSCPSVGRRIVVHPQDAALIIDFLLRRQAEPWMVEVLTKGSQR